jgi:hypothetical protein
MLTQIGKRPHIIGAHFGVLFGSYRESGVPSSHADRSSPIWDGSGPLGWEKTTKA